MSKNKKFRVPKNEQREYDLLVQRANRRIKKNLKYIQQQNIQDFNTVRALVHDYATPEAWAGRNTVFSRKKTFATEQEYKQTVEHLKEWGKKTTKKNPNKYDRSIAEIRKGYEKAIIKALTTTAITATQGVLTPTGRLPKGMAKQIRELSLQQLTNWFEVADPTEDVEVERFSTAEYFGMEREQFIDTFERRMNLLKSIYK